MAEPFRYWDGRRSHRKMPARADIAPEDFPHHLSWVQLVDVEGIDEQGSGIFRYRVVGTAEVELRGFDPTGRLVSEGFFGPSPEDVLACYETVRLSGDFLFESHAYTTSGGKWHDGYTLFLPLSEDGRSVSQVLVYSEERGRA